MRSWHSFSPWWSLVPILSLLIYGVMRSNYEHFCREKTRSEQAFAEVTRDNVALRAEVFELKQKPKLSKFDQTAYDKFTVALNTYGDDERTVLGHLRINTQVKDHSNVGLEPLPKGFSRERTAAILQKLLGDQIVNREFKQFANVVEQIWTIVPGAVPAVEDWLCNPPATNS